MADDSPGTAISALVYPALLAVMLTVAAFGQIASAGTVSTAKDITAIIQSIATTLGLGIAAGFAFYKWVWENNDWKRRSRMELVITGHRVRVGEQEAAICTLSITNCSRVDASLHEMGSGIGIDVAEIAPNGTASWAPGLVAPTNLANTTIRPGETAHDEIVIGFDEAHAVIRLLARIEWNWDGDRTRAETSAQVLPPLDPSLWQSTGTMEAAKDGDHESSGYGATAPAASAPGGSRRDAGMGGAQAPVTPS